MRKFDLIAGMNVTNNCGERYKVLGIVHETEGDKVTLGVVWSNRNFGNHTEGPAFFAGDILTLDAARDGLSAANEKMFPYDIPGAFVYCVLDSKEFDERHMNTQLMRLPRFQRLVQHVKSKSDGTSQTLTDSITEFMDINGYEPNRFLQGAKSPVPAERQRTNKPTAIGERTRHTRR